MAAYILNDTLSHQTLSWQSIGKQAGMQLGEPANKKTTLIIRGILGALAFLFILAFAKEIGEVLHLFWTLFKVLLLRFPKEELDLSVLPSFNIVFFNLIFGFGLVFLFWLFLTSAQALLPVHNLQEVFRTTWHLWLYITRRHGQAILVKDGAPVLTQEDKKRQGYGVVVVDFNSAIVLEERDLPPGISRLSASFLNALLTVVGLSDPGKPTRVCGPSIVFTTPKERIRGVVDLRRQFRAQSKVTCYTREGIELYANVWSMFTIGMDPEPDALQVAYAGDHQAANLRACTLVPVAGRGGKFLTLKALNDELDESDRNEIHALMPTIETSGELETYSPLPGHPPVPVFNEKRVFAAIFAQAQTTEQETLHWTDLPTRVAANFYREILSTINYDDLYNIREDGAQFPLPDYKSKLRLAMRNNGVLAYRVVMHVSGAPLVQGRDYHESELLVSEIRLLTNSKLLRDRGIKVLASGFGDLIPVSPLIYKQRLDSWRARWERELDITTAGRELQAMRVRSRALSNAQHDLWYQLNQLFSVQEHSDEALALRVMQALEAAAADPKTRELLPSTTMDMLRHINNLLLPQNTGQVPNQSYPKLPDRRS